MAWTTGYDARDSEHYSSLQQSTLQFNQYRTSDLPFSLEQYPYWQGQPVPRLHRAFGHRAYIFGPQPQIWQRASFGSMRMPNLETAGVGEILSSAPAISAFARLQNIKDFFSGSPKYVFQKTLGYGGNGICVHYKYEGDDDNERRIRDIALKAPTAVWQSQTLRGELKHQKKYVRSSHIVQILSQDDFGRPARRPYQDVDTDDSSDDCDSSGEEDIEVPKPPRKARKDLTAEELNLKRLRWYPNRPVKMVKQCIAMAFPVRKFHPDRRTQPEGDLDEVIPDAKHHWRMKRMVHFDIDVNNEFIADLDPTDKHEWAPKLKLGDFGLADEMKTQKRDCFYLRKRSMAKTGYFAPEQFTEDWDFIPGERNGANVCDQPVAGNYGPHTNVWAIALVLMNIISGCWPRVPPSPGVLTLSSGGNVITYGMDFLNQEWDYIDIELRQMAARCSE
ncbi:hypothetical protein F5B20DRAFT_596278 [Whalleya microplaca]|nr:hypothetical protein F5B20DRAFT_596278 [Whalleya microplaca]